MVLMETATKKMSNTDILDLGSIKRAIEILRKRDERPKLRYSYDTRIGLDEKELAKEPEAFRLLHNVLQQCVARQSCKHIDAVQIVELIMNCQNQRRDPWIMEYGDAVWSYGHSPSAFYLKWAINIDKCELLRYGLTELAQSGQLKEIENWEEVSINQLVAAEFVVDKCWYRAQILEIRPNEHVRVLFVDYGSIEYCYIHQLRALPQEFKKPNRLAFKAQLCCMTMSDDSIDGMEVLHFYNKLKNSRRIHCQIIGTMRGIEGFEVALFNEEGSVFHLFPPSSYITPLNPDPDATVFPFSTTYPLTEEIPLLVHKSEELFIQPRPWTHSDGFGVYSVVTVVDPNEIYVKNVEVPDDDLQNQLNEFCDKSSEWKYAYRIKTSRLFRNRLYAWYNTNETSWERVRVVREDLPVGKVYVQRLDYGDKLIVNIDDMMELSPRFCKFHSSVESAHLVHVRPTNGQKVWPGKTCEDLQYIFKIDTLFSGVLFSREASSHINSSTKWKSLGLLLTATNPRLPYSVQGILVGLGLAEGTGIGSGFPNLIFMEQGCPYYAKGFRNNGIIPMRNGTVTNMIFSSQPVLGTLKCPYKILGDDDELVKMGKIQKLEENQSRFMSQHVRSCLGWVNFTQLHGPGHFYLQMEEKKLELRDLMTDLEKEMNYKDSHFEDVKPGVFASVFYVHEDSTTLWRSWNRAFVIKANPKLRHAEVILIDFGIQTIVNYQYIRKLPLAFTSQIPYCQRAHLDVPDFMPTGVKNPHRTWSSTAVHNFNDYIRKWSVERPIYLAYTPNVNREIVRLNKFDQELVYARTTGKWVINSEEIKFGQTGIDYTCLNDCRDHNLLKHLFRSVGLQVFYEVHKAESDFYRFEPVWNSLLENGLLIANIF